MKNELTTARKVSKVEGALRAEIHTLHNSPRDFGTATNAIASYLRTASTASKVRLHDMLVGAR